MNLTIFAATGGIGRELLKQALAAGHQVTAVVRSPAKLSPGRGTRIVQADLGAPDPDLIEAAVAGADAVLSGLGARTKADTGVAEHGTDAIARAMEARGVRRLVVVSAAPLGTVPSPGRPHPPRYDPGDGFFMRHLGARFARWAFREHYADLARMEDLVRATRLDWTIVRPPRLTNGPLRGRYRTALGRNLEGGVVIGRADVAHAMLAILDQPSTVGRTLGLAY